MSKIFIISYSGNHTNDIEQIVKTYDSWFHFTKDIYLISTNTNTSATTIQTRLETKIAHGKDKLLVLEVNIKDAKGWLQEDEWEWLKSERSKNLLP